MKISPKNILPDEIYDKLERGDVPVILPADRADKLEAEKEAEYKKADEAMSNVEKATDITDITTVEPSSVDVVDIISEDKATDKESDTTEEVAQSDSADSADSADSVQKVDACEYLIAGEKVEYYLDSAVVCHVIPQYKGNNGFFHVKCGSGQMLLLKSCYEDHLRVISKGLPQELMADDLSVEFSKALLNVEGVLGGIQECWLLFKPSTGKFYLAHAQEYKCIDIGEQLSDIKIPRPLTASEYKKMQSDDYSDVLCSKAMIHTLLPDNITQTGISLLKLYPDAINAFFKMLELKTKGESLHVKGTTPYVNISSFIKSFAEIRVDGAEFANNYMPWQRILDEYSLIKPTLFLSETIPTEELDEFMQTIEESIDSCIEMHLLESEYFMPVAQISLVSTMLHFLFQEQVVYICHQTGLPRAEVLKYIFKSRADSLFIKGGQLDLPFYFDFNYDSKSVTVPEYKDYKPTSVDEIVSSMGFIRRLRRKDKVLKAVDMAHKILAFRDKTARMAGKFHRKSRKFYMNYSEHVRRKRQIGDEGSVNLFNLDEIKRIVNDSFYMSISSLQAYRASFHSRAKAQLTPYELYNGDSKFIGRIMEEQYDSFINAQDFDCFSFNATSDITGDVKLIQNDNEHEGYRVSDDILCSRAFPMQALGFTAKINEDRYNTSGNAKGDDSIAEDIEDNVPTIIKPKAIITDLAPILSYITEYSFIYDVPLYYGIRFSERTFNKKTVELGTENKAGKNSIKII